MSELGILFAFFAFVMGAVSLAGYFLILRPSAARSAGDAEAEDEGSKIFVRAFQMVGDAIPASAKDVNSLRLRLMTAGYRWPEAVSTFHGIKLAALVSVGLIAGWAAYLKQERIGPAAVAALCGAAFVYKLMDTILLQLIRARSRRIRSALPAALDLLILGVEAGQSLDQAIVNTSHELKRAHPDLSAELALAHFELQLGKSRAESLRKLAERNEEPELRKLTTLLIETDRFGTSAGPALRSHAKYLRLRMKQQAQESARKVGVKLVFPVFFLIFPSVLIVTLGPAVLLMLEQLRAIVGP
jgi:tight adherence protein C